MKKYAKTIVRRIWTSRTYAAALLAGDHVAFATSKLAFTKPNRKYSVLVSPSGRGNIGDQAMFDSFFANVPGRVAIIFGSPSALNISAADHHRTTVHVMPRLVRGMIGARFRDVVRFSRVVRGAERLYIPGADTIDGGHPHASLARLNLARLAVSARIPVSIQGFSWSPDAPAVVAESLRVISQAAHVYPRDPRSFHRTRNSGITRSTLSADMVFAYEKVEPAYAALEKYLAKQKRSGRPLALVNASGMIARRIDLRADYATTVEHLHSVGFDVVFLPHVLRNGDDDLAQCRRLFEDSGKPGDFLVDALLSPAQVKGIVSRAFLVITGRMHLAIMSLTHATPVLTMATVGKVEGLYDFFGLDQLVIIPRPGCASDLIAGVDDVRANRDAISAQIAEHLPEVTGRAQLNFSTLTAMALHP